MIELLLLAAAAAPHPLPAAPATPLTASSVPADEIDRLIQAGRDLLDEGKPKDAQVLFEEADDKGGGTMRTRVWVLRSWIDQGRYNDAFNEADRRQRKGEEGAALDYVYGMGSYRRALDNMAAGGGSTTQLALVDAATYLKAAVDGDPKAFDDAWTKLAHAAYLGQEASQLQLAADAAAKGVEARPKSHDAHYVHSLTAYWRVMDATAREDEATKQAAVTEGIAAAERASELLPKGTDTVSKRAEYHLQVATIALWKPDNALAARAYASAMGADPSQVDFSRVWSVLAAGEDGAKPFVACLEDGAKQYVDRWGDKTAGDATLLWWLGYAQIQTGAYEEADANLGLAVGKWPAYENAYWYQFEARYQQQDYKAAAAALGTWWERNPAGVVAMVQGNTELNVAKVFFTQGKCAEEPYAGASAAATCAEVLVGVEPANWERWDNLGLFSRDSGDAIRQGLRREKDEAKREEALTRATAYYERSWEAYSKALELAPEQPHLHNDAAVILHYCLDRDFEQAIRMYERSQELAVARLERDDLEDFDRQRTQIAKRDSADNLRKIKKLIEDRRKEAQKEGAGG